MSRYIFGKSLISFEGTGSGKRTKDGCSVDLYLRLPTGKELEIIVSQIPENASVLELGCGVGRITKPLVQKGFNVTAIDNSPDMLAHINDLKTICADIETLRLNKVFDAVLLMSYFVNIPDDSIRQALLATCKHHLKTDGIILIECHPFSALSKVKVGHLGSDGNIDTYIDSVEKEGTKLSLTYRWQTQEKKWTQTFKTELLDQQKIEKHLLKAGLKFKKWADDSQRWFTAEHSEYF